MARLAGVDLPNSKRIEIALTYIYGIGRKSANDILAKTGINPDTRAKDLTDDEVARLRDEIQDNYRVEGDLKRDVAMDIKRMVEINCYRRSLNLADKDAEVPESPDGQVYRKIKAMIKNRIRRSQS